MASSASAQTRQETDDFLAAVKAGDRAKVEFAARRTPALLQRADAQGYTALHHAAAAGSAEMARLLVERGAKLEAKTKGEDREKARLVYMNVKGYEMIEGEKTPLQLTGDPAVAAYLLSKGARLPKRDLTCGGDDYWCLRRWKPASSSPELLAAAMKAGADPNERCKASEGRCCDPTAFGFLDRPAFLQVLLAAGLNPNIPTYKGASRTESKPQPTGTLLHEASRQGNTEAVRLLLGKGAKVNTADATGATALAVAKTPEVAALLRAAGAQ